LAAPLGDPRLQQYRATRDRGTAWLLRYLDADGSLGDPSEGFRFYRAPWTLTTVGESAAATAVCGWIRRHMLMPDRSIGGPFRVFDDAYAYRNSALIVGAHMAQQFDLSHGLMPELLQWQDDQSGGFANDRIPEDAQSDEMDIPYTCGPGFACLATGNIDAARRVFDYLNVIYSVQPELPDRFYYVWSRSQQTVIRSYPEERRFWYVVENQDPRRQRWTIGGIAAAFLCRLYLADPRPEYVDLARRYQAFSMAATNRQFDVAQVCKSSWGSSLLYQVTGEVQYLDWTHRLGQWYVATQRVEGNWTWDGYETLGSQIELTLEFVMHIDTLIAAVTSRPPMTTVP
jgi:hypothetical protein